MKKTVALIYGGEGREREISRKSAANLTDFINGKLYVPLPIEITESGSWYIQAEDGAHETFPVRLSDKSGFLLDGKLIRPDCTVICLHGDRGEDGVIQGALEAAHIPYIGQNVYASAITADKAYAKLAAEHLGIPTAKWIYSVNESAAEAKRKAEAVLRYPMFIKPARLGSSFGASPARTPEEFESAFTLAHAEGGGRVMAEELVDIKYELECAYFNDGIPRVAPDGIIATGGGFYDYSAKYEKNTHTDIKPLADKKLRLAAAEYALSIAEFTGLRHISRIDFFVTRDNKLIFNEINTVPGMTDSSLYPRLCENLGLERGEFINRLIRRACLK